MPTPSHQACMLGTELPLRLQIKWYPWQRGALGYGPFPRKVRSWPLNQRSVARQGAYGAHAQQLYPKASQGPFQHQSCAQSLAK